MNTEEKTLKIIESKQGFEYQGPRSRELGDNSGEEFRDDYLIPWLKTLGENECGTVDFAGTKVYMSSFLEESFGGAVRLGYGKKVAKLLFSNMKKDAEDDLRQYISDAMKKVGKN